MGTFTSREAAEEFIAGDPFVTKGIVSKYRRGVSNAVLLGAEAIVGRSGGFEVPVVDDPIRLR
jgi:hypothetical protein